MLVVQLALKYWRSVVVKFNDRERLAARRLVSISTVDDTPGNGISGNTSDLLMMTTNHSARAFERGEDEFFDVEDAESIASLETDDGKEHLPEKILAEEQWNDQPGRIFYLVKWQDCPALRSSWESRETVEKFPLLFQAWLVLKQEQAEGKAVPLDLAAFNQALDTREKIKRSQRTFRRLKRQVDRVLSFMSN